MEQYTTGNPSFSNSISIPQTTDTNSADNINVSTKQLLENTLTNAERIRGLGTVALYRGVDLTVVFADEIAKFTSPWAWIKARLGSEDPDLSTAAPNLEGLNICDYIPLTIHGHPMEMQIAGFSIYADQSRWDVPQPCIDFISRELYPEKLAWGETDNNAKGSLSCPYYSSNIYAFLESLYEDLPEELQKVITTKCCPMEERSHDKSSPPLADSTGKMVYGIGKLWIPSEYEVYGSVIYGTMPHSSGGGIQYPIFSGSRYNIDKLIKGSQFPLGGGFWWLSTVSSGNTTEACIVYSGFGPYSADIKSKYNIPICFRVGRRSDWFGGTPIG